MCPPSNLDTRPYIPKKIDLDQLSSMPGKTKVSEIKSQIVDPTNSKIAAYRSNRLEDKSIFGRYSKGLFNTNQGIIYGKNSIYAIYNKNGKQADAAPEGAFGKIKFVKNLDTNEWGVLKTQLIRTPKEKEKFIREHLILSLLDLTCEPMMIRKGIKNKYVIGKADIIMKYVKGKDIFEYIEKKTDAREPMYYFPDLFWLHLTIKIAEELKQLHDRGIIHADIKFENILYDIATDKVQFIDFGNSFIKGIHQPPEGATSIRGFNPPESYKDQYDIASDIYAISMIFETLLLNKIGPGYAQKIKDPYLTYTPPKFSAPYGKETTFKDNADIRLLLTKMRKENPEERPSMKKVIDSLKDIYREMTKSSCYEADARDVEKIIAEFKRTEQYKQDKIYETLKEQSQLKDQSILSYSLFHKEISEKITNLSKSLSFYNR